MSDKVIQFFPGSSCVCHYSDRDRTLRYKDAHGNSVTVTAPEGYCLRFWLDKRGYYYRTVQAGGSFGDKQP